MRLLQLDGIRGVAIFMILAAHSGVLTQRAFTTSALFMVDLFFALSGFLITRNLLYTRTDAHYWRPFYIKRAGRILPALLLLMLIVPLSPMHIRPLAWLGYTFFLGNVMNLTSLSHPLLLMLWSLAVEEHFYLMWPAVIRFLNPHRILQLAVAILLVSPILRLLATPFCATYQPIYYLTCFRMDSIAAGALLALLPRYPPAERLVRRFSAPALTLVLVLFLCITLAIPQTFRRSANSLLFNSLGYTFIAAACFFLTACLLYRDRGLFARFCSLRPLVFLGDITYGLYLFHVPLLHVTRHVLHADAHSTRGTWLVFAVDLPILILIAWLSYRFIELPVFHWSRDKARALKYGTAGAVGVASQQSPLHPTARPAIYSCLRGLRCPFPSPSTTSSPTGSNPSSPSSTAAARPTSGSSRQTTPGRPKTGRKTNIP